MHTVQRCGTMRRSVYDFAFGSRVSPRNARDNSGLSAFRSPPRSSASSKTGRHGKARVSSLSAIADGTKSPTITGAANVAGSTSGASVDTSSSTSTASNTNCGSSSAVSCGLRAGRLMRRNSLVASRSATRNNRGRGSRRSSSVQPRGTTMASAWRRQTTPIRNGGEPSGTASSQTSNRSGSMPYATPAGAEHPGRSQSRATSTTVLLRRQRRGLRFGRFVTMAVSASRRWQQCYTCRPRNDSSRVCASAPSGASTFAPNTPG